MSGEEDLIRLYSKRILALAADMPFTDRLTEPHGTAKQRSPLCGSTVAVDIALAEGRISAFGQEVRACALGQAAASAVGRGIIGRDAAEIAAARDELHAMLKSEGPAPNAPFEELEALLPARDYKNRHASIMLTLDAVIAAFQDAEGRASA